METKRFKDIYREGLKILVRLKEGIRYFVYFPFFLFFNTPYKVGSEIPIKEASVLLGTQTMSGNDFKRKV